VNYTEWLIWNAVKDTHLAGVFGKCIGISETAAYLVMERLDPIDQSDYENAPRIPEWVQDKLPANFGTTRDGAIA
jgi:hypothetical protein